MKNINMGKFRAFNSAFDLQTQYDVIDIEEVEELLNNLYTKLPEYGMKINKVGNNKFEIKFSIDEEDINLMREDTEINKNGNTYLERIKKSKEKIESELEKLKVNYKTIIGKNANLTKEVNKLNKKLGL